MGEFAKKLRKWRGKRLQKTAASLLRVNLRTYQGWEENRPPNTLAIETIQKRMLENPELPRGTQPA